MKPFMSDRYAPFHPDMRPHDFDRIREARRRL